MTKAEILNVLKTYFVPLFSPASSIVALACAPGKHAEITAGFAGAGWTIEERSLVGPGGEEDDDDSETESGSGSDDDDEDMTSATGSESESGEDGDST